jgi:hypothetical protein
MTDPIPERGGAARSLRSGIQVRTPLVTFALRAPFTVVLGCSVDPVLKPELAGRLNVALNLALTADF